MAPAEKGTASFRERLVRMETRLDAIEKDIAGIYGIMKWVAVGIGGAILTAVGNFIINGGLSAASHGAALAGGG